MSPFFPAAGRATLLSGLMLSSALALTAFCSATANAKDLGAYGKITGDIRYKFESVDEEARPRDGDSHSVRAHLGYQTPEWNNLYAFGEVETVREIGPADYDDGLNGKTSFARISDPQMNGINQLYVHYKYNDDTSIRLGRQLLIFDNQRFVGTSKSRQNDPTQDALLVKYGITEDLDLAYAHSIAYRRYAGSRSTSSTYEGSMNLVNLHYSAPYDIGVTGYGYWLDFDGVTAEQNLSSRTHGLRVTWEPKGDGLHPIATAEFARQSDYGHSTLSYDENYSLFDLGARYDKIKAVISVETLGGNGTSAMQTPVGAAHALTGYTDRFSTIPVNGLRDVRLTLTVPYDLPWDGQSVEVVGQIHDFKSDDGDVDYGHEAGISVMYKPVKDHAINLKYATYEAEDFSSDTNKLIMSYEYKF